MITITTSKDNILNIPESEFPFIALTDNMRSFLSWGIKARTKGAYNHFMWYVRPGTCITQGWILKEEQMSEYLTGKHRVKLIRGKNWNAVDKFKLKSVIFKEAEAPWYKKVYDPLQVVGIGLGLKWLQIPGTSRICSDHASLLKLVDANYNLEHPSPKKVNAYTKANPDVYEVFMRFIPD
jgi:hypothetical protein